MTEGRRTIGTSSPNIQNQHKVLLKLYRHLDCSFESVCKSKISHSYSNKKDLSQLLIRTGLLQER